MMLETVLHLRRLLGGSLVLFTALGSTPAHAFPVDLSQMDAYIRRGFNPQAHPTPQDARRTRAARWRAAGWTRIPGSETGNRPIRIPDIKLGGVRTARRFLSVRSQPPETYTLVFPFELTASQAKTTRPLAAYFSIIGVNWAVYLNGRLLREEDTLRNGQLELEKNYRRVLIPFAPRLLRAGPNLLTVKIIGDPLDPNTGFFHGSPYLIGDYDRLKSLQYDPVSLILIFLYFFVGAFHVLLYFRRREDSFNLFFGLFSMVLFYYNFSRTHYIHELITDSYYVHRLEIASIFLLVPLFGAFLNLLLKGRTGRFTAFSALFTAVFLGFLVATPMAFVEDLLLVWQGVTLLIALPFYTGRIVVLFIRDARHRGKSKGERPGVALLSSLLNSVPGNLMVGSLILSACVIFDILNHVFWNTGVTLTRYGFFSFVAGTALLIANRFLNVQKWIEELNRDLAGNVEHLEEINRQVSASEERYRMLVEGTDDVVFTLNRELRIETVSKTVRKQLGHAPDRLVGRYFLDLVHAEGSHRALWLQPLEARVEQFHDDRLPVNLKLSLMSNFNDEPREFQVRLEYMTDRDEIIATAQNVLEDSLLKYFVAERQKYEVGNYITTADELSQRLVRNLIKYMPADEVSSIKMCLREILINAVEHGNLDVTFEEKSEAMLQDRYREFLKARQQDPKYRDRKVRIEYLLEQGRLAYRITDEGAGFDHEKVRRKRMEELAEAGQQHGRGIRMIEQVFDQIEYNGPGNSVLLVKTLPSRDTPVHEEATVFGS